MVGFYLRFGSGRSGRTGDDRLQHQVFGGEPRIVEPPGQVCRGLPREFRHRNHDAERFRRPGRRGEIHVRRDDLRSGAGQQPGRVAAEIGRDHRRVEFPELLPCGGQRFVERDRRDVTHHAVAERQPSGGERPADAARFQLLPPVRIGVEQHEIPASGLEQPVRHEFAVFLEIDREAGDGMVRFELRNHGDDRDVLLPELPEILPDGLHRAEPEQPGEPAGGHHPDGLRRVPHEVDVADLVRGSGEAFGHAVQQREDVAVPVGQFSVQDDQPDQLLLSGRVQHGRMDEGPVVRAADQQSLIHQHLQCAPHRPARCGEELAEFAFGGQAEAALLRRRRRDPGEHVLPDP